METDRIISGSITKDDTTEIVFENKIQEEIIESGELPRTGGSGTHTFGIIGFSMIAATGLWLALKKRASELSR